MNATLKKTVRIGVATGMAAVATVAAVPSPASAYCYTIGSHLTATLDWEPNGSDLKISWNGDHSVTAKRDLGDSQPTLSKSWVRKEGTKTRLTAGGGARFATVGHTIRQPYGALYSTSDSFARALSSDVQACT